MANDKLELVRLALAAIGDASAEDLVAFIEQRHGIRLDPRYLPIMRTSLREREVLEQARQKAKAVFEHARGAETRGSTDSVAEADAA